MLNVTHTVRAMVVVKNGIVQDQMMHPILCF